MPGAAVTVQDVTDLSITGSVDKATAKVGDTVKYTATVTNKRSCATAADIDTVPAGTLQFVSGEPAPAPTRTTGARPVSRKLEPRRLGDDSAGPTRSRSSPRASRPPTTRTSSTSPPTTFFNPTASDNAATFTTVTDTGAGCSTGGSASLLALVAVAGALYFVRRRRIA